MNRLLHQRRDERGAIAIVFAVSALILFVIAGLVVDLGLARDTRRDSQNAADASALAAANVLYPTTGTCTAVETVSPCFTDAVNAAKAYSAKNYDVSSAEWASCTDPAPYYYPAGSTPCISFTDDSLAATKPTTPTKVRVLVPTRVVNTPFGTLAGVSNVPVRSLARASLTAGAAHSCGLCVLGTGNSDLGNGDVTVTGGSIYMNGSVTPGSNGHLTAQPSGNTITAVGGCSQNCSPTATTGGSTIVDPYATNPAIPPTWSYNSVLYNSSGPSDTKCPTSPGIYGNVNLPGSDCVLPAGLYVFTGALLGRNNTNLKGTGVTLYFTCAQGNMMPTPCTSPGQNGGYYDIKNGDNNFSAPATGTYAGFAIIYDRQNTSGLNIQGNGNSNVTGTVYAPKAQLQFPGTTYVTVTNGPIIVGSLYGNGNTGGVNLTSSTGASIPSDPSDPALDQ